MTPISPPTRNFPIEISYLYFDLGASFWAYLKIQQATGACIYPVAIIVGLSPWTSTFVWPFFFRSHWATRPKRLKTAISSVQFDTRPLQTLPVYWPSPGKWVNCKFLCKYYMILLYILLHTCPEFILQVQPNKYICKDSSSKVFFLLSHPWKANISESFRISFDLLKSSELFSSFKIPEIIGERSWHVPRRPP